MDLKLERKYKKDTYTVGNLYYRYNKNDEWTFLCNTLEDCDRGLDLSMSEEEIKAKKIYAQTAIPTGTYGVNLNIVSPRLKNTSWAKPYGGKVPRLTGIKGFVGVLIHPGNYAGYETLYKKMNVPEGKPVLNSEEYFKTNSTVNSELAKYGINLPDGKYKIKTVGNIYEIYSVKDDTEGCILLGENKKKGMVINSVATYHKFMNLVKNQSIINLTII